MHMYSFAKQYIYLSTVIIYITVVFILNVLKATILRRLQYMDSQTDNFSKNPCLCSVWTEDRKLYTSGMA